MVKTWDELNEATKQTYTRMSLRLYKAGLKQSDIYHMRDAELAKRLNISYNIYTKNGKRSFEATKKVIKQLRVYEQPERSNNISKRVFRELKKTELKKRYITKTAKKKAIESLKANSDMVSGVNLFKKIASELRKKGESYKKVYSRVGKLLKIPKSQWKKKLSKKEKAVLKQYGY